MITEKDIKEARNKLLKIGLGDHFCCIYKNKDEQLLVVIPFMAIGLERNEKCVYIVDESVKDEIIRVFRDAGIDIDSYLNSRQIEFLTKEDAYLKEGYFDPDKMITLLKKAEAGALAEGYSGLRVTGEMTWVFTNLPGVERLIEYEAKLNYFFPNSKSLAICQYNQNRFTPDVLLEVIHTHPKIIIYDIACDNPYYIPPDSYIAKLRGEIRWEIYERIRDDIIRRSRREEEHERAREEISSIARFPSENPLPVLRLNADGKILYRNPATVELLSVLGLTENEIFKIFPADLKYLIKRSLADNKPFSGLEVEISGKVYSYTMAPLVEWNYVNLYGTDITERRKLMDDLRKEKERAEKYLYMVGFIIIGINANGEINLINKKGCEVLKYEENEAIGKNWFDNFIPQRNKEEIKSVFRKLVKGEIGAVEYYENSVLTKDGRERVIAWYNSVIRDDAGNIIGTVSSGEDITERRIMGDKLTRALNDWDMTFNAISDLVFIQDTESRIIKANKAFISALKMRPEDIIGKKCYEIWHRRSAPWPGCPFEASKMDKKDHAVEVNDPNIGMPFLMSVSPLINDKGVFIGSVHIAKDISEIKKSEKELKQKIRDLEVFHKAAVDREIKMVELKKKIAALEFKLNTHNEE